MSTAIERALEDHPIKFHGREISQIFFAPNPPFAPGAKLVAGERIKIGFSATHHGDHDQFWIVIFETNNDGGVRETARYNPRHLEGWEWKKED